MTAQTVRNRDTMSAHLGRPLVSYERVRVFDETLDLVPPTLAWYLRTHSLPGDLAGKLAYARWLVNTYG